ncbi:hypothetical protein KIW84_063620 [Lathyrus oleraceus]|uniref:Uncharacterized protein n=1 Tax=Pisum sativum TaxID=3888 RepID=A0A9D4W9D0_PEA|nr:hypothetical protein KIW84_063620 [Pisum sativum]
MFYQDLVREFYAHFTIVLGCAFSYTIRGIDIAMSLEDIGACLGIPSEGERISHGFTPDTEGWENFNNLRFYFSMSRISEQEFFYARHARSNSTKLFLSSKNMYVNDRMLHYFLAYMLVPKGNNYATIGNTEMQLMFAIKRNMKINWAYVILRHMEYSRGLTSGLPYTRAITKILVSYGIELRREPYKNMGRTKNVYAPHPAPEGGYTLELIYIKIHEMDIRHSSELRAMHSNINFLKQQNRHHKERVEEEEEEGDGENEEMENSD